MTNTILSLSHKEAMNFFMESEQFHGFELPEYFTFDKVLDHVSETIGDTPYENCLSDITPEEIDDLNLDLLVNKDGKYAVRPLTLANPYLYYFLVRELCNKDGWATSLDCFSKFKVPHILSCAIPVVKDKDKKEAFHKATTILNWWNSMEQRSLELSLEYKYMFVTDITNCYGSIDPQTIDMALSRKGTSHETNDNHVMAQHIMTYLRAFQRGRNIGIPQGSAIFDFVGEFVLGYSDLLLHEKLVSEDINGYEIIRYRDDYRIFCNNKDTLEKISYILQHVLEALNLRLNSQKTKISDCIVTDSIKPDKLFYIFNTPIFNKKGVDFDGIQKHLLYILMFGRQYPNAGQLRMMLSDLDKRVEEKIKGSISGKIRENITAITAVGIQIAIENVAMVHYVLRVISRIVNSLEDNNKKNDIISKIHNKLCDRPNSAYDQIWLQNITYQQDKIKNACPYDVRLCKLVMEEDVQLWNNSWLKPEYTQKFPLESICDKKTLSDLDSIVTFRETRAYYDAMEQSNIVAVF